MDFHSRTASQAWHSAREPTQSTGDHWGNKRRNVQDRTLERRELHSQGTPEVFTGLPGPTSPCPKAGLCMHRVGLSKVYQRAAGRGFRPH